MNTPVVRKETTVRTPHVDSENKLFGAPFYLRPDDDDSKGSDLELFKYKDPNIIHLYGSREPKSECIDKVGTVPYKKNTLILFLNTLHSIHGVTIREKTKHRRIFMNLIGETTTNLYETGPYRTDLVRIGKKR